MTTTDLLPGIETPAIVVDHARLERNIAAMAELARTRGLARRPHVKTHKIPEIAALQLAAGAVGITVATIGEAEVFVEHGATDVFIAYPLWLTAAKADRIRALLGRARVALGVDSAEAAANTGRHLARVGAGVEVLVEADSGHHRSGVDPAEVVAVARAARDAGLVVAGAFTFPGHSYAPDAAVPAARLEHDALVAAGAALRDAGFGGAVLSGGSTPSVAATQAGGATEVRPGVYVFGDAQQWELGHCDPGDIALTVLATVVSVHPDRVILDAGSKVLGADRAAWASGHGRLLDHPDARITSLSEHHATVVGVELRLGERVRVVPNHVCAAVNLVDDVVVVRDGVVEGRWVIEGRWAVAARGRNS
jgi:D-serine deaminase-like pyridoxal phosphate-dependent protein